MQARSLRGLGKMAAGFVVALPGIGIALLAILEGVTDPGDLSVNGWFHLGLAALLLLLCADFIAAIYLSRRTMAIILFGAGGFLAILSAAILCELVGPPVLLLLLVAAAIWAGFLARSIRATRVSNKGIERTASALG